MKEIILRSVPNQILKVITLSIVLFLMCFNFANAQNTNANGNGLDHANENATVYGGDITFADSEDYTSFCIDGEIDTANVILENASGRVKQWIITDEDMKIIGLPSYITEVNFDEAGVGISLIWHLSYNGIKPLVDPSGQMKFTNYLEEINGKYHLSNYITVERFLQPVGGTLEGGPFEFCVGDGEVDYIPDGAILLSGNMGTNSAWVVTDEDGNILGLPETYSDVNFDEAPAGTCLVWHLSYEDNVSFEGVENAADLTGCFALTNPVEVYRYQQPVGGTLEGGPFEFCVGDGEADYIPDGDITLSGNMGTNSAWVVTDEDGNILGLPETYSDVNFDETSGGTCLVWHLSYEDNVSFEGVENAADLTGCYSLTNAITVIRNSPKGGEITGGPFEFTVGDGTADNIAENAITLTDNVGANSKWVVTNEEGTIILALADNYTEPDFDDTEEGICKIWHLSYDGELEGLTPPDDEDHLISSLSGCFSLSNSISITKTAASTTSKFTLYPNPSKGTVNVEMSSFSSNKDNLNIKVYTLQNIRVYSKDYILKNSNLATFDVSSFEDGVYFVRVTNNISGKSDVKRLIVN